MRALKSSLVRFGGVGLALLAFVVLSASHALAQEEVTFSDANLEAAIREALGKPEGPITDADLAGLTELRAWVSGIANLSGIEHCVNLESLHSSSSEISDLSPLAGVVNLRELGLVGNQISDLSPLAGLVNLSGLWLFGNQISDLSPLAGLVKLGWLVLGDNQISDIGPLAGLVNLQELWLDSNQISDLSPLTGLVNLRGLSLAENQISEVSALASLTALQLLYLDDNQIEEIGPLAALTAIGTGWWAEEREGVRIHLGLSNNEISDITVLVSNPGIDAEDGVDLRGNPLSPEACETHVPALQGRGVQVLFDPGTSVQAEAEQAGPLPVSYRLWQNHPNPFNPLTAIAYDLPEPAAVTLAIYNLTGQRVATLVSAGQEAGSHKAFWDAQGLAAGVYLYRLQTPRFSQTRRMVLLK